MDINLQNVKLKISAVRPAQFQSDLPEVVFCGRSNVGKSSMINSILSRRSLARTSSTPGKTATINYYEIDRSLYLVDLPGYGFAQVSFAEKKKWAGFMEDYFRHKSPKELAFSLVDLRHPPTADDMMMARFLESAAIPYWVIATKADKLSKKETDEKYRLLQEAYADLHPQKIVAFSSKSGLGKEEVLAKLARAAEREKNV